MRTTTLSIDLDVLRRSGDDGVTLVGLMMAANDIAEANLGYGRYHADLPASIGSCRYFIRLQCGHLVEAVEKLLPRVQTSTRLLRVLATCSAQPREAFDLLSSCLPGGTTRLEFSNNVIRMRNNLAFHYDPKLIERALVDRSGRAPTRHSNVTTSDELRGWRFGVADDVEDSIVTRQVWQIPRTTTGEAAVAAADQVLAFIGTLCRGYVGFAHELSIAFLRDIGAVR